MFVCLFYYFFFPFTWPRKSCIRFLSCSCVARPSLVHDDQANDRQFPAQRLPYTIREQLNFVVLEEALTIQVQAQTFFLAKMSVFFFLIDEVDDYTYQHVFETGFRPIRGGVFVDSVLRTSACVEEEKKKKMSFPSGPIGFNVRTCVSHRVFFFFLYTCNNRLPTVRVT